VDVSEPEHRRPKELGRLFIERGLISEEQLREALAESQRVGGLLGRVLIDLGYVTDADLVRALTEQVGLEFVDLEEMVPSEEVTSLIDEDLAWRYLAIPVGERDGSLLVATSDPSNTVAFEEIAAATGRPVLPVVANRPEIARLIRDRLGPPPSNESLLEPLSRREPWHPWTAPGDNILGGRVFQSHVMSHSAEDVVVAIDNMVAFPYGFSFTLVARRRLGRKYDDWWESVADERRRLEDDGLRVALGFPDGATIEASPIPAWLETTPPPGRFLARIGGWADPWSLSIRYWVWPLPPTGPITVSCSWPRAGIEAGRTILEGEAIKLAAQRSVQLWESPPS
jgi:hypothetical protein